MQAPTQPNSPTFANPKGFWRHDGPFIVELKEPPTKDRLPQTVEQRGATLIVANGRIKEEQGGKKVLFYSADRPFAFSYDDIVAIRTHDGQPLWLRPTAA